MPTSSGRRPRPAPPVAAVESDEESVAKSRALAAQLVDKLRAGRSAAPPPPPESPPPLAVNVTMTVAHDAESRQLDAWDRRLRERYLVPAGFVAGRDGAVRPDDADATVRGAQYADASGMLDPTACITLINGVSRALGGLGSPVQRANAAAALLTELRPETPVEGLLAAQLIACHHAAMIMLERATITEQPTEIVDQCVTRAVRLQRVFLEQTAALAKLRGQGAPQRVHVEHVHKHVHVHATPDVARAAAEALDAGTADTARPVKPRQLGEGEGARGGDAEPA